MATITGTQTINHVYVITTDINPALGAGTSAPIGSLCIPEDGSGIFLKQSATDTDWGFKSTSVTTATVPKTASYTLTDSDNTVECNGNFTITLPTIVGRTGREYNITNTGSGTITLVGTSGQLINGETMQFIPPNSSIQVKAGSTQWNIQ